MGCWNESCFMSNLSIRHGDTVKLQLLVDNAYSPNQFDLERHTSNEDPRSINSLTYPNRVYTPIGFPIIGEYNSYGSLENIKDDISKEMMIFALKDLAKDGKILSLGRVDTWISRDRDAPAFASGLEATTPIDPDDLEEFISLVERGSIIICGLYKNTWSRVRFVMMHSDLYDSSVELVNKEEEAMPTDTIVKHIDKLKTDIIDAYYFNKSVESNYMYNAYSKIIDQITAALLTPGTDEENAKAQDAINEITTLRRESAVSGLWERLEFSELTNYPITAIRSYVGTCGVEKARSILDLYGNAHSLFIFLLIVHKPWALCLTGSQEDNHSMIAKHHRVISAFRTKYKKAHQ